MDLKHLEGMDRAMDKNRGDQVRLGIGLLFILSVMLYAASQSVGEVSIMLVMAAMVGGYMAMNIGANDVANNVGPAVGARALTLGSALVIAATFEVAGAIIAGGEVVGIIRNGIIDPNLRPDTDTFVWIMTSALIAGALWLNIATVVGAPVSTTHSIVGAVLGGGIAASGFDIVNWRTMGGIAASWVVSPVLGGIVAAAFLYLIKRSITYKADMMGAARQVVPWLVAAMAMVFSVYLSQKGLNQIVKVSLL